MNRNISWTPELMQKQALLYKSRSEFEKGSMNAYNAARYMGHIGMVQGLKDLGQNVLTLIMKLKMNISCLKA